MSGQAPPLMGPQVERFSQRSGFRMARPCRVFLEMVGLIWSHKKLQKEVVTWIVPGREEWNPTGKIINAVTAEDCPAVDLWLELTDEAATGAIERTATMNMRITIAIGTVAGLEPLNLFAYAEEALLLDPEFHHADDEGEDDEPIDPGVIRDRLIRHRLEAVGGTGQPIRIRQPKLFQDPIEEGSNRFIHTATGWASATYYLKT